MSETKSDYRDLRREVKEKYAKKREDFVAHELQGYGMLDRWWGVPGISKPLGLPEDLPDDSLITPPAMRLLVERLLPIFDEVNA